MNRVLFNDNAKQLVEEYRMFSLAIQLSRMKNIIRSNQRQYLKIDPDGTPTDKRDRLELILYHGAIIYEATETILKNSSTLKNLQAWKSKLAGIKKMKQDFERGFTHKYLQLIRHKLVFHYDQLPLNEMLSITKIARNTEFASAVSEKEIDLAYTFADELILNYLISKLDTGKNDKEKWEFFLIELLERSGQLTKLIDALMLDILAEYTVVVEE